MPSGTSSAIVRARWPDLLRIASREVSAPKALLDGCVKVDGDVIAVSRLPELFGMVQPLDRVELPAP
jgi:hypothetical protein